MSSEQLQAFWDNPTLIPGKILLVSSDGYILSDPENAELNERLRGITHDCATKVGLCSEETEGYYQSRKTKSSRATGTQFHQSVFHELMCQTPKSFRQSSETRSVTGSQIFVPRPRKLPLRNPTAVAADCICLQKIGTSHRKTKGKVANWVSNCREWLSAHGLRPLYAEYPVIYKDWATQIDLIATAISRPGKYVNVSWKTGYCKKVIQSHNSQLFSGQTTRCSTVESKLALQHRTQQELENYMLYHCTGIEITNNIIIYVDSGGISEAQHTTASPKTAIADDLFDFSHQ